MAADFDTVNPLLLGISQLLIVTPANETVSDRSCSRWDLNLRRCSMTALADADAGWRGKGRDDAGRWMHTRTLAHPVMPVHHQANPL